MTTRRRAPIQLGMMGRRPDVFQISAQGVALRVLVSSIGVCFALLALPAGANAASLFGDVARNIVYAPSVPQPANPGNIVGLAIANNSGTAMHNQPLTFGQVFEAGKVAANARLKLTVDGKAVPTQLDVKATNADGSVRMGIISVILPELSAGASLPAMLALDTADSNPPPDFSGLDGYDLSIDIAVHGSAAHHLNVGPLLAKALAGKHASYWLRGPVAVEARVDVPITGSLHISIDVRKYVSGSWLSDVAFKNDYSLQPVGGDVTYDVDIKERGKEIFQRQNISQFQYTNWHVLTNNTQVQDINVVHDIASLERSGAILNYDLTAGVNRKTIAHETDEMANGTGFDILQNAGVTMYMGMTGGRNDIGPTTRANTIWLLTQEPDAKAFALAQADGAGSVPWHFFDPASGTFRTAFGNPRFWADDRQRNGIEGPTQPIQSYTKDCGCFSLDSAHQPDLSFIPYLMTGSRYYLDQLEAQATWDILELNPQYRGFERGIIVSPQSQLRGRAWSLRGIINAAWIIPDGDPMKDYFAKIQSNNFGYLLETISKSKEGEAHGWFPCVMKDKFVGAIAPWQEDYMASVILLAAKRDVTGARSILEWQTNFLAGRFLSSNKGFPPEAGGGYHLFTYAPPDPIEGAYKTWAEIARASLTAEREPSTRLTLEYTQAAKGVLAGIVSLTNFDEARAAYAWLDQNMLKANLAKDQLDPTWRLAPPN